jgi:putative YhbY family RNA-binding protein
LWCTAGSGRKLPRQNSVGRWDNGVNYMLGVWSKEAISNREGTAFDKKRLRRLQSKSRETDATIWIGKEGASDELLKQVSNQLKARELVKLKVHKSALANTETGQLAAKVASSTSSTLVEVMGHTFTLFKRRQIAQQRKTH